MKNGERFIAKIKFSAIECAAVGNKKLKNSNTMKSRQSWKKKVLSLPVPARFLPATI